MNQKKCPKCGEMNPAEAVMCWACYTPLAGGAVGVGAGGAMAVGAPGVIAQDHDQDNDRDKKKSVAPWQMGLVGLGLLLLLGVGVKTMSGPSQDSGLTDPGSSGGLTLRPTMGGAPTAAPAAAGPNNLTASAGSVPPPGPARFTMVSAPNPSQDWDIMAIVPTDTNMTPGQAARLASFASTVMIKSKRPTQIYVFADRASGQQFSEFQMQRRSAILNTTDYTSLGNLWSRCLARYEDDGTRQRISYPQSGGTWWARTG